MMTAHDVANAFLELEALNDGDGLTNMKLQKLVYYAQGFFLALHGRPLFAEPIEAWTHGPVVPELYHAYKSAGRSALIPKAGFDLGSIPADERDLIEEVYKVFGQFSAWRLRNMTHEEPTWRNHEEDAEVIPHAELMSYFKTRLN
jgi:uncharacterized phage-associated protein